VHSQDPEDPEDVEGSGMIGAGVTPFERWVVRPLALVFLALPTETALAIKRWHRRVRG
jgi:hypothetical protein